MIGVQGPPDVEIDGLQRIGVGSVNLVPVASPDHPLARGSGAGVGDCRNHVQLVLTDRSTRFAEDDHGVMGTHTWRVADLATRAALSAPTEGRALYAGLRTLDVPEEPVARLWHAATLLREHRGGGHNAALLAHGIGAPMPTFCSLSPSE